MVVMAQRHKINKRKTKLKKYKCNLLTHGWPLVVIGKNKLALERLSQKKIKNIS